MSRWVYLGSTAHHAARIDADGVVLTECGVAIYRPDYIGSKGSECWLCAEHVYARDNRKACAHCHKVPRRAA